MGDAQPVPTQENGWMSREKSLTIARFQLGSSLPVSPKCSKCTRRC
jgi:hypothetical protein